MNFKRNVDELREVAAIWWPTFLSSMETEASIIPMLLQSQEKFISLLKLSDKTPFAIFDIMKSAGVPGNLLLKHLVILADVGGENLQRINADFPALFQKNDSDEYYFDFLWQSAEYRYVFKELPVRALTNAKLSLDGKGLKQELPLSPLHEDVAAILLFGSAASNERLAETFAKCEVGALMGLADEIDKFVDQRYIWVNRITGGAKVNSLGQAAQIYVADTLRDHLGQDYKVRSNGRIIAGGNNFPFDVVVSRGDKSVGIEISFQVTTNSTIERKGNEAESRYHLIKEAGHFIAYIVDGAGNFNRRSAITKICNHSDCTVAYTESELKILEEFIQGVLI